MSFAMLTTSDLTGLYCGPAPEPDDIWASWNLDPLLLAILVPTVLILGRAPSGATAAIVLVVAFVSPLCALSAALFSARVVHHLLLVAVAAPLIALTFPSRASRPAMPLFLLSTGVLWGWHLPQAYDAAMSNISRYWLMQVTLLATAIAFWREVLAPSRPVSQAGLAMLAAYLQMGFLGALLTFAPVPFYAIHQVSPLAWGFSPLTDQQLGGLIMWVPAGIPYAVLGAFVALRAWRQLKVHPA